MAHVHGEKMVGAAKMVAEKAARPMMMESGMGGMMDSGMGMGNMMGSGMGSMMEHGTGAAMGGMMKGSGMGTMMGPRAMTAGAAAAASATGGRSLLGKIVRHPLVLLGAGLAVGYLIHKYREGIIQSASTPTE